MRKKVLYSPLVLILATMLLISKGFLNYYLAGSFTIASYVSTNFFYIMALVIYFIHFLNFHE